MLTWKEHIVNLSRKLSKSIALIRKASNDLNRNALNILYWTIFYPYLNYCAEVWGNTYKSTISVLFLKQKKVIRLICNAKYLDHTTALFQNMNILRLDQIITFKTALVMFKAYHSLLPKPLQNRFYLKSSENHNTRQKVMFI